MENEIWKDIFYVDVRNNNIIDYRGLYQVSNKGNVKSLNYNHTGKEKLLKLKTDKDGYRECLLVKNKENKYFRVHRLVAEMFIDNPDKKHYVDHIIPITNGGTDCAENLRWVTMKENQNNEITNSKRKEYLKGDGNPNYNKHGKNNKNSIPVIQCDKNGNFIKEWESISEASKALNLHTTDISKVCRGIHKTCGKYKWFYKKNYKGE